MEPPIIPSEPPASAPLASPSERDIAGEQFASNSEYHGDFTTVHLKKSSPHGEINLVAHLGLPSGAFARINTNIY